MKKIIISIINSMAVLSAAVLLAGDTDINQQFLTKNSFKHGTIISSGEIIFSQDGRYTIEYGSEGMSWYNKGAYSIKNDTVYLKPDSCASHKDGADISCGETMGDALCVVQTTPNDLYFYKYFICTSEKNKNALAPNASAMSCPVDASRTKAGMSKIYKGMPVIIMGLVKGVTATNVKIREKPSINSKSLEYIKELYSPDTVQQSVPAGTEVIVIARTRDRDKVQSWNNYWYLVSLGVMSEVWMYGEFVKLK